MSTLEIRCADPNHLDRYLRCSKCSHAPARGPMTMAREVCPRYLPWLKEMCLDILDRAIHA